MDLRREGDDYVLRLSGKELRFVSICLGDYMRVVSDSEFFLLTTWRKEQADQLLDELHEQWARAGGAVGIPDVWLALLREELAHLAAPPEEQLRRVGSDYESIEDIGVEVSSVGVSALALRTDGLLSAEQVEPMEAIGRLRGKMAGPQNKWLFTEDAIRTDPTWREVRELAAEALRRLPATQPSHSTPRPRG